VRTLTTKEIEQVIENWKAYYKAYDYPSRILSAAGEQRKVIEQKHSAPCPCPVCGGKTPLYVAVCAFKSTEDKAVLDPTVDQPEGKKIWAPYRDVGLDGNVDTSFACPYCGIDLHYRMPIVSTGCGWHWGVGPLARRVFHHHGPGLMQEGLKLLEAGKVKLTPKNKKKEK
jgi:hypothetical protein